jgi:hypothetical protein
MRRVSGPGLVAILAALLCCSPLCAQDEDFHVYGESPRLLLTKQRLRLLQRERERKSGRWEQFASLIEGGAQMPEPGFANALHYRVSGTAASAKKAVDWALASNDLRQVAYVFDWCGPAMTKAQSDALAKKLEQGLAVPARNQKEQTAHVLAAAALGDRLPDEGQAAMKAAVEGWWRKQVVPSLNTSKPLVARSDTYSLFEMMHVLQDTLKIDLRESAQGYFKQFVVDFIAGHYPASFPAAENEYRIPVYTRTGEPDLDEAAMSRAAGFAMVAYDNNAQPNQFLQGYLMQDQFAMKGALGAVYEFLWANPYQPGLSYFHIPLVFHDADRGHVFARTSWDDDATWIGFFDGTLQMFSDGQVQVLKAGSSAKPVQVGDAVLMSAPSGDSFKLELDSEALFLLGLQPHTSYEVEIDDQEMTELETDAGGTLVVSLPPKVTAGARFRKSTRVATR